MNKTHAKRLLKLADHLDTLPRKEFDFGTWSQVQSCGTTACALGHACTMPAFRRLGAKLVLDWVESEDSKFLRPTLSGQEDEAGVYEVSNTLFGLNYDEVERLFYPGNAFHGYSGLGENATPKQVARHIRKFVKERTAQ